MVEVTDPTIGGAFGYSNGQVRVWTMDSGELLWELHEQNGLFRTAAFTPDGETIAIGGGELYGNWAAGEVRILEVTTGRELKRYDKRRQPIECVAFSPDASLLAFGGLAGELEVYEWGTDARSARWTFAAAALSRITHIAFSSDGELIAVALGSFNRGSKTGEVRVFDSKTGDEQGALLSDSPQPVLAVAFSGDSKWFAAVDGDARVRIWRIGSAGGDLP